MIAQGLSDMAAMTPRKSRISNSTIGMWVTIASFTMLFGTLILSYLLIRARQSMWPPIGTEPLDARLATLSTFVIVVSSWAIHFAHKAQRAGDLSKFRKLWSLGTLIGVGFMALQVLFLKGMYDQGLRVQNGLFPSINYTIIIFHGIHVVASWLTLAFVNVKALVKSQAYSAQSEGPGMSAMFWHFLDVVWVLSYVLLIWL